MYVPYLPLVKVCVGVGDDDLRGVVHCMPLGEKNTLESGSQPASTSPLQVNNSPPTTRRVEAVKQKERLEESCPPCAINPAHLAIVICGGVDWVDDFRDQNKP